MKLVLSLLFLLVANICNVHGRYLQKHTKAFSGDSDWNNSSQGGGRGGFGGRDGPMGLARVVPPGIQFFNDTCAPDAAAEPTCLVGSPWNETAGAWICRTLFDIVTGEETTFTACVDTDQFLETDICGCCNDTCPDTDPCPCECDLMENENNLDHMVMNGLNNVTFTNETTAGGGVLVQFDDTTESRCVPTKFANRIINGPGFFGRPVCVEECN